MNLSSLVLPLLLAAVAVWGMGRRVDVYAALTRGAGDGLAVLLRIIPALVGLLTAVSMFRASGAMEVLSTLPGVQFYTGNYLAGCPAGKGGAAYDRRWGFCLETQSFPDSPNHPNFPSCVLRAGETFTSTTTFRFTAE